jgi:acyl-CoA thioesterase I
VTTVAYDPRRGLYVGGRPFGLPEPLLPVPDADELELLVRFEHPGKFLAVKELPGGALRDDHCLAQAYGSSPAALARVRDRLRAELWEAADLLLGEGGVREAVAAFGVPAGGTFVALGDSITDDVQSWAELLRCCLERVRPDEVTVVNAGVSGDTTADALARLHGIVALRPDLVIAMLGTNDCQLHGPHRAQVVSPRDSRANVAAISRWLRDAGTRVVWLTPPPVDREALAASVGERRFDIHAGNLRRFTESLTTTGLEVVDTGARLAPSAAAGDLLPDGVHPTLTGQRRIAETVLLALGSHSRSGCEGASGHMSSGIGHP